MSAESTADAKSTKAMMNVNVYNSLDSLPSLLSPLLWPINEVLCMLWLFRTSLKFELVTKALESACSASKLIFFGQCPLLSSSSISLHENALLLIWWPRWASFSNRELLATHFSGACVALVDLAPIFLITSFSPRYERMFGRPAEGA